MSDEAIDWVFTAPQPQYASMPKGTEWPDDLYPAAEVQQLARRLEQEARTKAAELANDPRLTAQGKQELFTQHMLPHMAKVAEARATLDELGQRELAAAEQLAQVAPVTTLPPAERLALAQAFGRLEKDEKLRHLQDASTGKNPELREALAYSQPLLTGLGEPTRQQLREQIETERLDHPALAKAAARGSLLADVRRALDTVAGSVENAADREQLRSVNAATFRRSDMKTAAEKSEFISARGLAAFQALPA